MELHRGKEPMKRVPRSVTSFARNNVCLQSLGEQIQCQKLLHTLCLVSRLFNAEFSPFVYREVRIRSMRGRRGLLDSANLVYVKVLSVNSNRLFKADQQVIDELVPRLLVKMPNLEEFIWTSRSGFPLPSSTVQTLHRSCRKIKRLHVEYPKKVKPVEVRFGPAIVEDQPGPSYHVQRDQMFSRANVLPQFFTRLEELTIDNMYDDMPNWRAKLVQLLKNSPRLRRLGLSISHQPTVRAFASSPADNKGFFDLVCDEYADTGASPLHLQSLKCGAAILPQNNGSLEKLTDLAYLEDVHIANHDMWAERGNPMRLDIYCDDEDVGIPFIAFASACCPNLRRFTVAHFRHDASKDRCSIECASFTRQLAISPRRQKAGNYEMAKVLHESRGNPGLPMQLRMLDLELEGSSLTRPSVGCILADMLPGSSETLEGLCVHLPGDRYGAGDFHHVETLRRALPKLPNLTQLAISEDRFHREPFGSIRRTSDKGILRVQELVYRAEGLAKAARKLRYISIDSMCWRVWRGGDGMAVRLEELEEREWKCVELFGYNTFNAGWYC